MNDTPSEDQRLYSRRLKNCAAECIAELQVIHGSAFVVVHKPVFNMQQATELRDWLNRQTLPVGPINLKSASEPNR